MKKLLLLFFLFIGFFSPTYGDNYISPTTEDFPPSPQLLIEDIALNNLEELELLIEINEDSIIQQKKLLLLLKEYQRSKNYLMEKSNDDEKILETIRNAKHAWEHMKMHHLSHLFSLEYLKELKVFARVDGI